MHEAFLSFGFQIGGLIGSVRSQEDGSFEPFLGAGDVFDDRYEFPVPVLRPLYYSQTFCKATTTASLYDNRELREQLRPMVEKEAAAMHEELDSGAILLYRQDDERKDTYAKARAESRVDTFGLA